MLQLSLWAWRFECLHFQRRYQSANNNVERTRQEGPDDEFDLGLSEDVIQRHSQLRYGLGTIPPPNPPLQAAATFDLEESFKERRLETLWETSPPPSPPLQAAATVDFEETYYPSEPRQFETLWETIPTPIPPMQAAATFDFEESFNPSEERRFETLWSWEPDPSSDLTRPHTGDQRQDDIPRSFHDLKKYPCVFRFAGCDVCFTGKNEKKKWKKHVTQHMQLRHWVCTASSCGENRNDVPDAHSPAGRVSSPLRKGRVFLRKEEFIEHAFNTHGHESVGWGFDDPDTCVRLDSVLPQSASCPGCGAQFLGKDAWDQRMEHVAAHIEEGQYPMALRDGGPDKALVTWAASPDIAIIRRLGLGGLGMK